MNEGREKRMEGLKDEGWRGWVGVGKEEGFGGKGAGVEEERRVWDKG